jgi:hypothetical protein
LRHKKGITIALFALSLVLFAIQAGIWIQSTSHARTETDKQNIVGHHQPNEFAAVAGTLLLVGAAVIASIPPRPKHQE